MRTLLILISSLLASCVEVIDLTNPMCVRNVEEEYRPKSQPSIVSTYSAYYKSDMGQFVPVYFRADSRFANPGDVIKLTNGSFRVVDRCE